MLGTLGIVAMPEEVDASAAGSGLASFQTPIKYAQWHFDGRQASFGNGTHVAFSALSREAADRFYAAALAHGGISAGAPAHIGRIVRPITTRPIGRHQAVCGVPRAGVKNF